MTRKTMPKANTFHIKIPETCPLCHTHLPLEPPVMCPHLRARLLSRYALDRQKSMTLPPPYQSHCCPTFPSCLCERKQHPRHFSQLTKPLNLRRNIMTLTSPPRTYRPIKVLATKKKATTQASPGSIISQGEQASRSRTTKEDSSLPSTSGLDWMEGSRRYGGQKERGMGKLCSTPSQSTFKSMTHLSIISSTTPTCPVSTPRTCFDGRSTEPSNSWGISESMPKSTEYIELRRRREPYKTG